ncbi:hypothetical protein GZH47_21840 [Paenibacillus rhizovicinus]|uniref:S-layer protein n=1 Tax=Paenibacillus rhizovicinus TaxID=2704463 RepID=A0A6C0P625_9BACL|nr:endo-alpha-N-acetylgalactosaminidase family protein [Paenibacillus rhizovicinus]QHW33163.1 hypothetical protein GZH47_21840 [Paenibacillus rhizovicinus]
MKSFQTKISGLLVMMLMATSGTLPAASAFHAGSRVAEASPASTVYSNTFESGSEASLAEMDGVTSDTVIDSAATYSEMNGQFLTAVNPNGGNEIVYFNDMPDVANGTVEAKISIDGGSTEQFGLITRYTDPAHYALIVRDPGGWLWDGFNGGAEAWGVHANPAAKLESGKTYTIKEVFNGDSYEVYLDGNQVFSQTTDNQLPTAAGKIGFRSYYSKKAIHIDDIKVTDSSSGQIVYARDFTNDATAGMNMSAASAAVPQYSLQTPVAGFTGKVAKLTTTNGSSQVVDTNSPQVSNGSYSAKFQLNGDYEQAGLLFRYRDAANWSSVRTDSSGNWQLVGQQDGEDVSVGLTEDPQPLSLGTPHTATIDYAGDAYTLTVDGTQIYSGTQTGFSTANGYVGYAASSANALTTYLDELSLTYSDDDVYTPPQATAYIRNYEDGVTGTWNKVNGSPLSPAPTIGNNGLTFNSLFDDIYDNNSLAIQDGTYTLKFRTDGNAGRIGFIFKYMGPDQPYAGIYYDSNGHWGWQTDGSHYGEFTSTGPDIVADTDYTVKIKYIGQSVKLWLNDVLAFSGSADFPAGPGKAGLKSWNYPKKIEIRQLSQETYVPPTPPAPTPLAPITIASDKLSVSLDNRFPAVRSYTWLGGEASDVLQGQSDFLYAVNINGNDSIAAVNHVTQTGADTAVYNLDIPVVDDNTDAALGNVNVDVTFKAVGNKVQMNTHINREPAGFQTRTFSIPNQKLVSVSSSNADAQGAASWVTGAWNTMNDEFYTNDPVFGSNLKSQTPGSRMRTYGFVSDGKLAAALMNDVVETPSKVVMDIEPDSDGVNKQLAMWNGAWTVRGDVADDSKFPPVFDFSSTVIVSPDANGDGTADWKDAAIGFRELWSQDLTPGADQINDYVSYISMNFNSLTQNPYLRTLDNAKKLYNLYDGFGQLILEKGYESEGHDDSHPDVAGHFGIREGGLKDFNTLVDEGLKYNVKVGVHTNIDAQDPDAYYAKPENWADTNSNYDWVDPTYPTDRAKDLSSGELERRYTQLKQEVPNLAMVYDDIYSGAGWHANQFANIIQNKLGFWFGTEFSGPMEQNVIWTHWGTDPYYPSQTAGSLIIRFIKNQYQDTFQAPSPYTSDLLRGMLQAGVGTWQGRTDIQNGIDLFYNNNLLTKYMQHFPILDIKRDSAGVDSQVVFGGGVTAQMENYHASASDPNYLIGTASLKKDGKTIAVYDVLDHKDGGNTGEGQLDVLNQKAQLFLPWDPQNESKIYYWNPKGGSTTWDLPDSWSGSTTVEMYKLTDNGRAWDRTLTVSNGQVTIGNTTIGTPYVIYKSKSDERQSDIQQAADFGVGGPLKDPGFDSGAFASWQKTSAADAAASHVSVAHDYLQNSYLKVTGKEDATISQTVTGLTPGKTYTASVWADINNGSNANNDDTSPSTSDRNVSIEVNNYGGPAVVNSISASTIKNLEEPSKFKNTYYERMKVDFTADATGKATIELKAAATSDSTSNVWFDDVKLWENPGKTVLGSHYFYEDFENVSEGYGPFMFRAAASGNQTHLAEKASDAQKAADPNISQPMTYAFDGNYSLKSNEQDFINNPSTPLVSEILGTVPSTLKLQPHKTYKVGIKYQANTSGLYRISAKSRSGGPTVSAEFSTQTGTGISNIPGFTLPIIRSTGTAAAELELNTGDYSDYYLAIEAVKPTAQPNYSATDVVLVVDDLVVDDLSAPAADAHIASVDAVNGTLHAVLSDNPASAPTAADFAGTVSIGGATSSALAFTNFSYEAASSTATFTFNPIARKSKNQSVVVSASYHGEDAVAAAPFVVHASSSTGGTGSGTGSNAGSGTGSSGSGAGEGSGTTNDAVRIVIALEGGAGTEVTVNKTTQQTVVDFAHNGSDADISATFSAHDLLAAAAVNGSAELLLAGKDVQYPLSVDVLRHIIGLSDFIAANHTTEDDLSVVVSIHKVGEAADAQSALGNRQANHRAISAEYEVNLTLVAPNGSTFKAANFDGLRTFFIKIDNSYKGQPLAAIVLEKDDQGNTVNAGSRLVKQVILDGQLYAEVETATHSIYAIAAGEGSMFKDMGHSSWAKEAVEEAASRLLVTGRGGGIYDPKAAISRAEYMTMLVNALGLGANPAGHVKLPYSDVAARPGEWPYDQLAIAYQAGLLDWVEGPKLEPTKPITRAEMVRATAAFAAYVNKDALSGVDRSVLNAFADAHAVAASDQAAFAWSIQNHIVTGTVKTLSDAVTLSPGDTSNRAQAAVVLLRALGAIGLI